MSTIGGSTVYCIHINFVRCPTHSDSIPSNDDDGLRAQQEGVETEVVDTQVHPALSWERPLPVATRIVCGRGEGGGGGGEYDEE